MDDNKEEINEKFLVVIEIYGLQFSKSMNLKYKNQKIYIFPNNYFEFISHIKKEINFLNSPEYSNQLSVRFKKPMLFETGPDKRSLIITTLNLNIEISFDELVHHF
ncbi:hypothetical protein ES703_102828 [subsurface metagenome]